MTEQLQPTITIDGVEHDVENLNNEQKSIIGHLQLCDQQISHYQNMLALTQTARQAYINDLGNQLNTAEDKE